MNNLNLHFRVNSLFHHIQEAFSDAPEILPHHVPSPLVSREVGDGLGPMIVNIVMSDSCPDNSQSLLIIFRPMLFQPSSVNRPFSKHLRKGPWQLRHHVIYFS